jgi:hypothetical protein
MSEVERGRGVRVKENSGGSSQDGTRQMSEVERGRGVLARKDVTTERCRGMKKKKMGDV